MRVGERCVASGMWELAIAWRVRVVRNESGPLATQQLV